MTFKTWIELVALLIAALKGIPIVRSLWGANKRQADLKVRLERAPDQIVLWNDGEGEAEDVRLVVTRKVGPSPIERDARRKLPLARLDPGAENECPFSALVAWEIETGFHCVITWRDPGGDERRKELPLYI